MSYVPSHAGGLLAQPESLVFIPMTQGTSQIPSVNTKIQLDAAQTQFGTWSVSITNDVITLPSGYFYLIESSVQALYTTSAVASDYYKHQIYDETNGAYVGTEAKLMKAAGEDSALDTKDEKARYYVDCSSISLDISIKTTDKSAAFDRINYTVGVDGPGYLWTWHTGSGRVIIWRLSP